MEISVFLTILFQIKTNLSTDKEWILRGTAQKELIP